MDSGSYNNVRRGTMPLPSAGSNTSYKANVNRTKTRKWVEAKVQNYDGDDWGNEYDDDYDDDDGNDQHYEPDPVPSRITQPVGLRQPGQSGHQLPSSRTFPQPAATSLSNADSRALGSSAFRSTSGPLPLHVQTQTNAPVKTSPPYATESAHPATTSSHANLPSGSYSAGPTSTPSRFPPRKSSMGQHDRPDIDNKSVPKTDSRPGSSSSNRPWVDQRSASPSRGPAPAAKTLPFVRPADIYKRVDDEKEKERLSMESGRPSLDSIHGRTDGTSPAPIHSSGEQRRRVSLEGQDGPESTRARKSSLAPVAERKSEYGMDGFLAKSPADQPPTFHEPALSSPELSIWQSGPNDEVKADLMKSRRFSTSPQLPTLTRVSGFGDDFFSSSGNNSSWTSPNLSASPQESRLLSNELKETAAPIDSTQKQPLQPLKEASPGFNLVTTVDRKLEVANEGTTETIQPPSSSTRPQLPGGWISESTTVPVSSEQPTPSEKEEAHGPTLLANVQNINISPTAGSDANSANMLPMDIPHLPSPIDTLENTSNTNLANDSSAKEFSRGTDQHDDAVASEAPATALHDPISQSPKPLEMETELVQPSSRPTSTIASSIGSKSPKIQTSSTAQPATAPSMGSEISPTAPLNPNRAQVVQPEFILSSTQQRQSTISTIETAASPEKESDKLRDEIIKSLSPAPISPSSSSLPTQGDADTESKLGDLTRESTYLSGVYDDYLSLAEDKSLQELSQVAKTSSHMVPGQTTEAENGLALKSQIMPVSQPAPLSPVKGPVPHNTTIPRRFSWQRDGEEAALNPDESKPAVSMLSQESLAHGRGSENVESNANTDVVSPITDSLHTENGATGTISHQVSQVSSLTRETSLGAIEAPSPVSFAAARRPNPISDVPSAVRLSLADEKEKVLIGDAQSSTPSTSEQHPALTKAPEPEDQAPPPAAVAPDVSAPQPMAAPMPFREILNLGSYAERVQKFEETREQFYVTESGLSNWLVYLQSQPEHTNVVATGPPKSLLFKPGAQPASVGASGAAQLPNKSGPAASHPRRMSIGGVQQLMAGQASGFGASGNQMGTKSKELLHAAGAFGNKGMKSGMKLFNKGKNKLRERAAGDKAFF
ncbi:hypothetical protein F5Y12DRAFT_786518 [Xylaria sp. FL1777]|nr:hypothetical protein F5Y12DRAFT_786518 [Xylaria sp. FL1777]